MTHSEYRPFPEIAVVFFKDGRCKFTTPELKKKAWGLQVLGNRNDLIHPNLIANEKIKMRHMAEGLKIPDERYFKETK